MIDKFKDIVSAVISPITKMVDEITTTDEERGKLKSALEKIKNQLIETLAKERSQIIQAEAKSESWLTRNWRPMIMTLFGIIIANNYIIYPYLSLIMHNAPKMEIPPDMWQLLKLGLSGYVIGRTAEKIFRK
jgi:hypothetical protein